MLYVIIIVLFETPGAAPLTTAFLTVLPAIENMNTQGN